MKYFLTLFIFLPQVSIGQSLCIPDFDSIIQLQRHNSYLNKNARRFIEHKIPFYSIFGSNDENGSMHNVGLTFKNDSTKEILWIKIDEDKYKEKLFFCEMGYTAPLPVIEKIKEQLLENGYKYKKKKKYYLRKKSRKEYNIIMLRPNCVYVSDLDNQSEMIFTVYKKLD